MTAGSAGGPEDIILLQNGILETVVGTRESLIGQASGCWNLLWSGDTPPLSS